MDALIEAGICYKKKMGGDAHAQYEGKHRVRYQPARIDGQPLTAAKLDIYQFYRKEFHEVLNVLIAKLGDNRVVCLHAVKPIEVFANWTTMHCNRSGGHIGRPLVA